MIVQYTAEQIGVHLREMLEKQIEGMVRQGLTLNDEDSFSITLRVGATQSESLRALQELRQMHSTATDILEDEEVWPVLSEVAWDIENILEHKLPDSVPMEYR